MNDLNKSKTAAQHILVDQVRKIYGEPVKVVFKQMPLWIHQHAFKAAQASICASDQRKFWEYMIDCACQARPYTKFRRRPTLQNAHDFRINGAQPLMQLIFDLQMTAINLFIPGMIKEELGGQVKQK